MHKIKISVPILTPEREKCTAHNSPMKGRVALLRYITPTRWNRGPNHDSSSFEVPFRKLKFFLPQVMPINSVPVRTITIELLFMGKRDLKNKNHQEKDGQMSAHEASTRFGCTFWRKRPIISMSFCHEGRLTRFPLDDELVPSDYLPISVFETLRRSDVDTGVGGVRHFPHFPLCRTAAKDVQHFFCFHRLQDSRWNYPQLRDINPNLARFCDSTVPALFSRDLNILWFRKQLSSHCLEMKYVTWTKQFRFVELKHDTKTWSGCIIWRRWKSTLHWKVDQKNVSVSELEFSDNVRIAIQIWHIFYFDTFSETLRCEFLRNLGVAESFGDALYFVVTRAWVCGAQPVPANGFPKVQEIRHLGAI